MRWHLLTGEYPPDWGGVADHTAQLVRGLTAAGHDVHVWTPRADGADVHPIGNFGPAGLSRLEAGFNRFPRPRTILVQYTPHAFGWKSLNLGLVAWLLHRKAQGDDVRVLFHEVSFPWVRRPIQHNLLAAGHRLMAAGVVRAARQIFVTVPAWIPRLRAAGAGQRPITVLPVPANVPDAVDPSAVRAARARVGTAVVVGHFGTYGASITDLLGPTLRTLLDRRGDLGVLLIGGRATGWQPAFGSPRVIAPGPLPAEAVTVYLRACDLLIQPYPDGVSGRRTTVTAALANGIPVVTNLGPVSEPWWVESDAVELAEPTQQADTVLSLLETPVRRDRLSQAGRRLYDERFHLRHTLAALLADGGAV